jgi:hypothetical protein
MAVVVRSRPYVKAPQTKLKRTGAEIRSGPQLLDGQPSQPPKATISCGDRQRWNSAALRNNCAPAAQRKANQSQRI